MSFRLFVYYCAVCGAWTGFVGWFLGRVASPANELGKDGVRGMMLGLFVALGLSIVDGVWNLGSRVGPVLARVCVAVIIGALGGLLGGVLGHTLYAATLNWAFLVLGWTLTGLLIGASVVAFELAAAVVTGAEATGSRKKLGKCLIGGACGGLLGGTSASLVLGMWRSSFPEMDPAAMWTPTAVGFVAVGMSIGLLVGLAQVILKQAWIKVEAGFRPGREMILAKACTSIGRDERCDLGLFGDAGVEKQHARILLDAGRYMLENGAAGTYLNEQPVNGRVILRSGDLIRLGSSVLRFYEKQKRAS